MTFSPRATRSRLRPRMAAPTASAKIAVWEVRDLGELDIKVLENGRRARHGARRPVTQQARPTAQGRTAAILPGARVSRALRPGPAATSRRPRGAFVRPSRRWPDDAGSEASVARVGGLGAALGRGRTRSLAHGPVPAEPPTVGVAAPRLDVRADPDPRHRGRRRLLVLGGPPGRRGPPARTRCRAGGRSHSWPGCSALALALLSGIERYDTTPVLDPHGPARAADARGRAAPGARPRR